ncbi:MAG: DegV family protein [Actinomycetales bacterium]
MPGVAVVTDSTACLTDEEAHDWGVTVVPLHVDGPEESLLDTPSQRDELVAMLRRPDPLHTSRPSPVAFADAYRAAVEAGADGIVSGHLSADMSGTWASAALAARDCPVPVRVVDSRTMGAGLGTAVRDAAARAAAGAGVEEVSETLRARARSSVSYFLVESLEPLRRGGRIGAAASLVGGALSVRPILGLVDGRVVPVERLRTGRWALNRLLERVSGEIGASSEVVVHHLDVPERAEEVRERLVAALAPNVAVPPVRVREISAAIGVHVGVGVLGIVWVPPAST